MLQKRSYFLVFLIFCFASIGSAQIIPAPVIFQGDTLFIVNQNIGSFTTQERAAKISANINSLSNLPKSQFDSIKVVEIDTHADIIYENKVIMTISVEDGIAADLAPLVLANRHKESIRLSLIDNFDNPTLQEWIKDIFLFILALLGFFIVFSTVNRAFNYFRKNLKLLNRNIFFKSNKYLHLFKLISPETERGILLFILRMFRFLTLGFFLYLYLPFMFSQISYTRGFGEELLQYVLKPIRYLFSSFANFLPNLLFIVVIITAISYLIKAMSHIASQIRTDKLKISGFYPDWATPTFNLLRVLVIIFTVITIFPYLPGSGSDAFKGMSVFVGLLLSFGSAGVISNVISGVILTYMRPFKTGDRVQINNITGDVISRNLLVTRIRTPKNEEITMPNASLLGGGVINYTSMAADRGLILHTSITIGYDVPWITVHELLITAALATECIESEPKPFVLQQSLNDFNVQYEINAYTKESHKMPKIYSSLHSHIQDKFNEAGVEIMSPHFSSLRDGNSTTIPTAYLNPDYAPPKFGINVVKDMLEGKNKID